MAGEQPIVTDAVEAAGQDVQQEATDELVDGQGHGLVTRLAFASIVFVAERDPAFVQGDEPAVGDSDPVRVTRQVGEHRFGSGERGLGINMPIDLGQWGKVLPERPGIGQCLEIPDALQLAVVVELVEAFEEQPPEQPRQYPHGQEEPALAGLPLAGGREPAARDHAVHMRVMGECRSPGMQYRGKAELRAQVLGIGRDRRQRLGRGLEQRIIDHGLVLIGNLSNRGWQREHDMVVRNG